MSVASLQCSLQYLPNGPSFGTRHLHDGCAHLLSIGQLRWSFRTVSSCSASRLICRSEAADALGQKPHPAVCDLRADVAEVIVNLERDDHRKPLIAGRQ